MPVLSTNQWRTACIVTASVTAFLLAQPEGVLPMWAKVIVGCVNVAVAAVINPPQKEEND